MADPPRVLLVTPHWPPRASGHGDYSWNLAHALADAGLSISVLVLGQEDVTPSGRLDLPVRTAPFPGNPGAVAQVSRIIVDARPTVVCLQFEANAFRLNATPHLLPLMLRARGLYVVLMYHELWAPSRFGRMSKLALLNAPNRVVTFSEWHAEGVRRFRRVGRAPDIVAVPSNIDGSGIGDRRLVRARFGIAETDTVVTFFGFIIPEHGIHDLLTAFAGIREVFPGLVLSVVGGFDPVRNGYHQELLRQSRELGIDSAVTWHGRVDEPRAVAMLLAITDAGVLPYSEGVGENNGAFVAMAQFGIPMVTTRGARSALMEREGVACFVDDSVDGLSDGLASLLSDPDAARRIGATAAAWSRRRTWSRVAAAFMRIFDRESPTERLL